VHICMEANAFLAALMHVWQWLAQVVGCCSSVGLQNAHLQTACAASGDVTALSSTMRSAACCRRWWYASWTGASSSTCQHSSTSQQGTSKQQEHAQKEPEAAAACKGSATSSVFTSTDHTHAGMHACIFCQRSAVARAAASMPDVFLRMLLLVHNALMHPSCRSSADDVPRSTDGMVTAALTNPLSISDVSSGWVQVRRGAPCRQQRQQLWPCSKSCDMRCCSQTIHHHAQHEQGRRVLLATCNTHFCRCVSYQFG
jgi:hypothetical protein